MRTIKKIALFFVLLMFLIVPVFAESNSELNDTATIKQDFLVPANVTLEVILSNEINSQNAIVGQNINAILQDDFIYNNKLIAPKDSILKGSVVLNKVANRGKTAQTKVCFTKIQTPYNNIIPVSATILTIDETGVLKGNSYENKKNVLISSNSKITIIFNQPITHNAQ